MPGRGGGMTGEPALGGFLAGEDPEVVDVANLLARIDVNPNGAHT